MLKEGQHWATSYALKAEELYYCFPYDKYIHLNKELIYLLSGWPRQRLFGQIFRYFFYLVIKDIIENQITFKLPPGQERAWLEMEAVTGDEFLKARLNGAFLDVDYLASDFTGYALCLRYNTRYGNWKKRIHVSSTYRDKIIELTNKGVTW